MTADTPHLNVERGETVNLHMNGQRLTWNFNDLGWVVKLQEIAPSAPDVDVHVYEPNDN